MLEDYSQSRHEPRALLHQFAGRAVHVVWDYPVNADEPAVLVTVFEPDR